MVDFTPAINASQIRLHPYSWYGSIQMKIELLGCTNRFPPLGMESKAIADEQITSSSSTWSCQDSMARVAPPGGTQCTSWCADDNDVNPHVTVDLLMLNYVTGLTLQGQENYGRVSSFQLQYSTVATKWTYYSLHNKTIVSVVFVVAEPLYCLKLQQFT